MIQSPFPGMDPYTEARHLWKGIHTQLIGELSIHQLPPLLAPAYFIDAEPSLQVRSDSNLYPDLQIITTAESSKTEPVGLGLPVMEATATITVSPEPDEEDEESAIFIRSAANGQLVTAIEILSYSNKTGGKQKRARYLLKRQEYLDSGIHLVEIDLLRWGKRVIENLPEQPYCILSSRADEQPRTHIWSFDFTQPIPDTPLPLIGPNEYVPIPLQTAYTAIYQARRFRQRLNYSHDPEPPLTDKQRESIRQLLYEAGIRSDRANSQNSKG